MYHHGWIFGGLRGVVAFNKPPGCAVVDELCWSSSSQEYDVELAYAIQINKDCNAGEEMALFFETFVCGGAHYHGSGLRCTWGTTRESVVL